MNRREILDALADEREQLVRDLGPLQVTDWDRRSLCDQWAVRDVVAHLVRVEVVYRYSVPFFGGLLRYGSINRYIAEDALKRAGGETPDALLAALTATRYETTIGARFHPFPAMPLGEWVIHGQDIRRPLGITRAVPTERLVAVADALFKRNGYPWGRKHRPPGRFEATDAAWDCGTGEPVRLPLEHIVMLLAGREV